MYWNGCTTYCEPDMVWTWGVGHKPRVGADYNFSPKNPFEKAKSLRTVAEKRDEGAIFTLNKASQTHNSGDIKIAFEANTDARAAWEAVRAEVASTLAAIAIYEQNPLTDKTYVPQWKSDGNILKVGAEARLSLLGSDRAAILALSGRGAPVAFPPGPGAPGSLDYPGGGAPPKSDWTEVAGTAAIVAVVSAVVYTGWKLLTKGSL